MGAFCETLDDYNASTTRGTFDPFRLDGLSTGDKLAIPKSNWDLPINQGAFVAYGVTCGITFTYSGLNSIAKRVVECKAYTCIAAATQLQQHLR